MRTPDLGKMRQLSGRLNELARVPSQAARAVADKINTLLAAQFEAGVDPYGRSWDALKPRTLEKHDEPPLQGEFGARPGDMAEGTQARPEGGAGISVSVPFPGSIHQTGSVHMARRAILPDGRQLPPDWKEAINSSVRDAANKAGR